MRAPYEARAGLPHAMATRSLRAFARLAVARRTEVRTEGLEHLPAHGPVVIAARHVHHLYDATVLLVLVRRPPRILVALDWVRGRWGRRIMEWACRTAGWPFVLRGDSPHFLGGAAGSAYRPEESLGVTRRAVLDVSRLLQEGHALLVFPEGYPEIDPEVPRRSADQALLPFRPGFAKLVARAQRVMGRAVPIVPAGFHYRAGERWQVAVRFGPPAYLRPDLDLPSFVRQIEARVRALSGVGGG